MSVSAQDAELATFCRELLAPMPDLQVWQWVEANVTLPERSGALTGQYSTDLTPYIREPLQCYADKTVTDLTLCWGTQLAKTTLIMVGTCYRIACDPMNCLWIMPASELAKSFSKSRWIPLVDACPVVAAEKPVLPNGKPNRFLFGFMEQQFDRMMINFTGSNSAAQLASRPAGLINMDETDKFKFETEKEAAAIENAEERAKNFPYPLKVKTSTPTTVHGEIWKEFRLGDMRYFHLPCPHCSTVLPDVAGRDYHSLDAGERAAVATYITLKFSCKSERPAETSAGAAHGGGDSLGECGVRWWRLSEEESKTDGAWDMEKVRKNAFYKCQRCGGEILDSHKTAMLRAGVWVPTNPSAKRSRRSYHLSSLYSLLSRECTFGAVSVAWLETKGNLSKRHKFINSTLAEVWDDERAHDDHPIFKEDFGHEDLPVERTNIMAVDVQEGHFWVGVRTFAPKSPDKPMGESWLLFYGGGKSDGTNPEPVETIEEVRAIQREYGVANKNVVIDMAHKPNTTAKWIVESGTDPDNPLDSWRGLWGSDKTGFAWALDNGNRIVRDYSPVQYRDPHLGTIYQSDDNRKALWMYWSNPTFRDTVAVLRHTEPCIWHIHSNVTPKYQKQLNAFIKITERMPNGRYVTKWKQIRRDEHALDVECMITVRAQQLGLVPTPDESPATA